MVEISSSISITKPIIDSLSQLKRSYSLPMRELKEMSGAGWDNDKGEVLLDDDVWESIRIAVSDALVCYLPLT